MMERGWLALAGSKPAVTRWTLARRGSWWVLLAAFAYALLAPETALAHQVGLSRGQYVLTRTGAHVTVTFARGEVAGLVAGLDTDGSGSVVAEELAKKRADVLRVVVSGISARAEGMAEGAPEGAACTAHPGSAELTEEDGLEVKATYECPQGATRLVFKLALFDELSHGHRHVASATSGDTSIQEVLFRDHADFEVPFLAEGESSRVSQSVVGFIGLGVEHILTGWDHLLFLFGLIVVGGRTRSLVAVVTAFTVAHSITLALAVLGILAPSPRLVEPAIALSIAYVGIENFFVKDANKRWRLTFPFGLVHGFGFAGALQEIALPAPKIPMALVSFNVGVELGQLAVMAVLLPLVWRLRKEEWFVRPRLGGVAVLSGCVVAMGLYWFVERVAQG